MLVTISDKDCIAEISIFIVLWHQHSIVTQKGFYLLIDLPLRLEKAHKNQKKLFSGSELVKPLDSNFSLFSPYPVRVFLVPHIQRYHISLAAQVYPVPMHAMQVSRAYPLLVSIISLPYHRVLE